MLKIRDEKMILGVRELYRTCLAPNTVSESSLFVKQFSSAMVSQDVAFKETARDKAILISERFPTEKPFAPGRPFVYVRRSSSSRSPIAL